jgi:hypothetical protein
VFTSSHRGADSANPQPSGTGGVRLIGCHRDTKAFGTDTVNGGNCTAGEFSFGSVATENLCKPQKLSIIV